MDDLLAKLHRLESKQSKKRVYGFDATIGRFICFRPQKILKLLPLLNPGQSLKLISLFRSGLFDFDYYLANNPDVEASDFNPLVHYFYCGGSEGRKPNPLFDSGYYLSKYPDVKKSGINPLFHYLTYGEAEGRECLPGIKSTSEYKEYYLDRVGNKRGFLRSCLKKGNYSKIIRYSQKRITADQEKQSKVAWGSQTKSPANIAIRSALNEFLFGRCIDSDLGDVSKLSIIILNLNGESLLSSLLQSLFTINTFPIEEIIVVDHNSSDNSCEVVELFSDRLPVKLIRANQNYSFSYSNNRAVELASGDICLFLNNDVVFEQDCLRELVGYFKSPDIGVIGLKLYEISVNQGYEAVARVDDFHHIGVRFKPDYKALFYRPYNVKPTCQDSVLKDAAAEFPAVTGAFMAVRKKEFIEIGGFAEGFDYGYEDVDLCLKYHFSLAKKVVSANNMYAIHADGKTRKIASQDTKLYRRYNNDKLLRERFGFILRNRIRNERIHDDGSAGYGPLRVAFAVTEVSDSARAGDFFTAMELGQSLHRKYGFCITYLPLDRWYQLADIDVVIAMRDDFNPSLIEDYKPHLLKIAWLRNWFERWCDYEKLSLFDIVLTSSDLSAKYVQDKLNLPVKVLRIATNPRRFTYKSALHKEVNDYLFTGSYWGAPRDIENCLVPSELSKYSGAIYGAGWDFHHAFQKIYKGFAPYEDLSELYKNSRVVIDDANHVTKSFASVNSRVFDAIASGCLPITNGQLGAFETFGDLLPTYDTKETLEAQLDKYLTHGPLLREAVEKLYQEVLAKHTYDIRASEIRDIIVEHTQKNLRFSIKIPVPSATEKHEWGDYHFAESLRKEVRKYGHSVRIDVIPDWSCFESLEDDVVIVLRGLTEYEPLPDKINILWNISHPDKVPDEEYEKYDHVFVASSVYSKQLQERLKVPVSTLIQCTDPDVFFPEEITEKHEVPRLLFVGNSRKVLRKSVKFSIEKEADISVYGTRWSNLIPSKYLKDEHIPNKLLHSYYGSAEIVLNDHWESMVKFGFLSNRLFDVGASMGFVISDHVLGLEAVFSDAIPTYRNQAEFDRLLDFYISHPDIRFQKAAKLHQIVVENHTFAHRADEIMNVVGDLVASKFRISQDPPLKENVGSFPIAALRKN